MRLNFPHEVANRIIDLAFVFRENEMAKRVVERDPMWESAIAESLSTVGAQPTRWVDRIRQTYQTLDEGGGRPVQSRVRDPWGREIVKCDPTCTADVCAAMRQRLTSLFGNEVMNAMHCAGCLECTLMSDS